MDIRPILSTLSRHKTAAGLIVLEVALTCAIICNAVFLIAGRIGHMNRDSGVAESTLVRVQLNGIGVATDAAARTAEDLAALRAVPGVVSAASTNQTPLGQSSWNTDIRVRPDQDGASLSTTTYMGSEDLVETLGVRIIQGRDFLPEEYVDFKAMQAGGDDAPKVGVAIVTRAIAEKLFPGETALGKSIYLYGADGQRIVGIVDTLQRPSEWMGSAQSGYSTLLPVRTSYDVGGTYLVRVQDPAQRAQALKDAVTALEGVDRSRIILGQKTFEEIRADYYRNDRSMAWLLAVVCVALLVVTSFGIIGLASFWVAQRTRQIGVRRALGATRGQILAYFQTENFLLSTLGIFAGMVLAYGINQVLMSRYSVPRLPLAYLPVGAILLWGLGQLAALGPAIRAAAVPPAVATRSA
jgi:putative ABC transport system permease protein